LMLLFLVVWLDCNIRGFDSLLRLGTNSLLAVLWCSMLSFFAMIGIKKMVMFMVPFFCLSSSIDHANLYRLNISRFSLILYNAILYYIARYMYMMTLFNFSNSLFPLCSEITIIRWYNEHMLS
jgi:hypothetical protein